MCSCVELTDETQKALASVGWIDGQDDVIDDVAPYTRCVPIFMREYACMYNYVCVYKCECVYMGKTTLLKITPHILCVCLQLYISGRVCIRLCHVM